MANDFSSDKYSMSVGKSGVTTMQWNPTQIVPCYIVNLITGMKINFATLPTDVSEDYAASFGSQQPMGRSSPYFNYENSEARTVSYSVTLHKDIVPDMENVVLECKKLVYPKYTGSLVTPPYCYVRFGAMINMTAIVNSVSIEWGGAAGTILGDTLDSESLGGNASPTYSDVQLSFSFTELRLRSLMQADNVFDEGPVR